VLVYPFFEPTRLLMKKVPQWSFLLCFFRLSKYEKSPSFPSLGSLNLHRRTLPLCVLSTAFASFTHQPCNSLRPRFNTFGHWRIFSSIIPRTSVLSSGLELACLRSSFLPCNVIFFYSFQIFQKEQKNQIYPKKRMGKVFSLLAAL
jgi:hypothetical protein